VVLAGGKGRRLQIGAPKALARVAGVTLLERAVGTLRAICDEVVTVAPEELALPIPAGSRRVHDSGRGPLEALVAGLEAAPYQRALVLGVDFPLISPATLTAIAERLGGAVAAVPRPGAWLQPLVAAYAPSAAAALAAAIAHGERALLVAVEEIGPRVIEPDEVAALPGGIEGFLNLNGPEDLAEAERRLDPMVRG
jgi:molybdopterin-guanine dinucleotide biosynthesis protein A